MDAFPQMGAGRHEYTMQGWQKGLYFLLGILFAAFAAFAGWTESSPDAARAIPIVVPLFFWAFGGFMLAWPLRARLIIDGTRIEVRGIFRERSADIKDIKGFRTFQSRNGSFTKLYLKDGRGSITISNSFSTDDDYRTWFQQLTDLDKRDRDELLAKIAHERDLGTTPDERMGKLSNAKTWSIFLTIVSGVAAAALAFGPLTFHVPAFTILMVTPAAAFFLLQRSPLLYSLLKQKADPRAEMSFILIASGIGLILSCSGLHFVSMEPLLLIAVPIALVYFWAFYLASQKGPSRQGRFVALLFFAGIYGFGFGMLADTIADNAPATTYSADVLGKHISHGRSTTYYLELSPWGPKTSANRLSVPSKIYGSFAVGDQVCLSLHPGSLHAPWYQIVDCTERLSPDLTP
ncbi:MAG: hypothetical protein ACLPH3_10515 [Terracidiphilus sp.]